MFQELKLKIPGQIRQLRLKNSILDPRRKMELKHMYVGSLHLNRVFHCLPSRLTEEHAMTAFKSKTCIIFHKLM